VALPRRGSEPPQTPVVELWGDPETLVGSSPDPAPPSGPARLRRRVLAALDRRFPRRYRRAAAAVAVVLCLGAWWVDQHRRTDEFTALMVSVQHGQASVDDADRRVASMIEYVSPLLHAASTPPDVRAGMDQLVHGSAVQEAAALRLAAAEVAAVPVWGWHHEQVAARDAYVADLRARAAYYQVFLAVGSSEPGNAVPISISSGWFAARQAFLVAATSSAQRAQVETVLTH